MCCYWRIFCAKQAPVDTSAIFKIMYWNVRAIVRSLGQWRQSLWNLRCVWYLKFKSVSENSTEINHSELAWSPCRRTSETMANFFLFDIAQKRSNFDWQNEHSEREERLFRKVAFCDFIRLCVRLHLVPTKNTKNAFKRTQNTGSWKLLKLFLCQPTFKRKTKAFPTI